ncbi:phage tail protein [Eggerthella sinensis]|uniref:phage tail protein n=1 Tax=Eggerthella sinensis TaxID=242230 RepID=UPI00266B9E8C|nr:phage tail protein [Eggerthella sinensis]
MPAPLRPIIEVPCTVDAIPRFEVLRQLDAPVLRALGLDPDALSAAEPESAPELSDEAARRIDAASAACLAAYEPRGAYKVFNPAICTLPPEYVEPAIKLVGTMMMFHGQSVYERLRRAAHCALMAVTIGPDNPEALPADADELDRALADACAKALVECAADHVNAAIVSAALEEDLYTDDRLSPGMGDFPLDTRSQFVFYTQSEKRLGLKLGADGAFSPRYSTVGVVGLYDPSQKNRKRACGRCKYRSYCSIRAIGMTCHGAKGTFAK